MTRREWFKALVGAAGVVALPTAVPATDATAGVRAGFTALQLAHEELAAPVRAAMVGYANGITEEMARALLDELQRLNEARFL